MLELKEMEEMKGLYKTIGEDNINNVFDDLTQLRRCENLLKRVNKSNLVNESIINKLRKGNKIVLGGFN